MKNNLTQSSSNYSVILENVLFIHVLSKATEIVYPEVDLKHIL